MLKPEDTRRGVRQIDAVVEAMGALAPDEVNAVRVAVVQCIDDLQGSRPVQSAAVEPEELVLFAAYEAATLTLTRDFLAGVLKMGAADTAASCARTTTPSGAQQGRRM
jgi:hypothetical protein